MSLYESIRPSQHRRLAVLTAALLATVAPGIVAAPHASAATVSLAAVADTYVNSGQPSSNYGTSTALRASSVANHALLRFDTTSIPAGSTVSSVTLRLYALSSPASGGIRVHPSTNGWTETGATWSSQPAWNSTVLGTSATPAAGNWISISLPAAAITPGASTNLALDYGVSGTVASIGSRESATQPQLTFSYTAGTVASSNITKILTIVEENHSYTEMRAQMPYLSSLSDTYGYATNYTAIRHPSLPNYLAIVGGSTFGVTTDCTVSTCPIHGAQTVFDEAIAAGRTAKVYAEDMTTNCQTSGSGAGNYAVRHTAWPYFTDSTPRADCLKFQVPAGGYQSGAFATDVARGTLPTVGMLIPNLCDDAHDCSLSTADSWLQHYLGTVLAGPDWRSGHLAIVVTADEDDSSDGNTVLTTVIAPTVHGKVVSTPLTHYSLSRLLSKVSGSAPLNQAATAADLAQAFGLTVGS